MPAPMQIPPRNGSSRRANRPKTISVSFGDDDLRDLFFDFADAEGCTTVSEAARMLFRIALAATPLEGAICAGRTRAFTETRNWISERIYAALTEIRNDLQGALPPGSPQLPPVAPPIATPNLLGGNQP